MKLEDSPKVSDLYYRREKLKKDLSITRIELSRNKKQLEDYGVTVGDEKE